MADGFEGVTAYFRTTLDEVKSVVTGCLFSDLLSKFLVYFFLVIISSPDGNVSRPQDDDDPAIADSFR